MVTRRGIMSSKNIVTIVKLIESGSRVYAKALSNISNEYVEQNLFDIYTVKKCAILKLKPLQHNDRQQAQHVIDASSDRDSELATKAVDTSNDEQYLQHLAGVENKIIADIELLLDKTPELGKSARSRLKVVKNEMENCLERIHSMRSSIEHSALAS